MTSSALSPLVGAVALILSSRGGAVAHAPSAMTRHDFYVTVKSTAPAMLGAEAKIYVREVVQAAPSKGVVLFVHGAGTPSEVAFDVQYEDYSWMEFLAKAGFDVFAMDMTGYGRSTRPPAMSDPCNLSHAQQAEFIPAKVAQACAASFGDAMTTMSSDWDDSPRWWIIYANCATCSECRWSAGRRADRAPAATPRSIRTRSIDSSCSPRPTVATDNSRRRAGLWR